MDLTKRHLISDSKGVISIIEAGVSCPEGSKVLGPMAINRDGSFEENLSSIKVNDSLEYYHNLEDHRADRMLKIRRGRNGDLDNNDKAFIIALKKGADTAAILADCIRLRDLPIVAMAGLKKLDSIDEINKYNP